MLTLTLIAGPWVNIVELPTLFVCSDDTLPGLRIPAGFFHVVLPVYSAAVSHSVIRNVGAPISMSK